VSHAGRPPHRLRAAWPGWGRACRSEGGTWSDRASAVTGEAPAAATPSRLQRDAAEQLYISAKTVDHHLQSNYRKLGLHTRIELAHWFATQPKDTTP